MSEAADRAEFELSRVKDRVAKLEKRMLSGISSSVLASWPEEILQGGIHKIRWICLFLAFFLSLKLFPVSFINFFHMKIQNSHSSFSKLRLSIYG